MNTPTHIRRFVMPSVRELAPTRGDLEVPPEQRLARPSQRSLVTASLLVRPHRAGHGS